MPDSHHHAQQNGDEKSARAVEIDPAENRESRHHDERDPAGPEMCTLAENRVDSVSAVELTGWYQVQRGHEQADPRGEIERIPNREIQVDPEKRSDQSAEKRIGE